MPGCAPGGQGASVVDTCVFMFQSSCVFMCAVCQLSRDLCCRWPLLLVRCAERSSHHLRATSSRRRLVKCVWVFLLQVFFPFVYNPVFQVGWEKGRVQKKLGTI